MSMPSRRRCQCRRELAVVPVEPGPVLKLMDVHSPHLLRRLGARFTAGTRHPASHSSSRNGQSLVRKRLFEVRCDVNASRWLEPSDPRLVRSG
jgi:hypothetical protein